MSLFARAARFAATILTTAGLLGASAPALATDVATGTTPAAVSAPLNSPVPSLAPQPLGTAPIDTPIAVPTAPKASFASLADAVAAQDGLMEDEHLRCLASAVYFESQGEPLAGQLAVAQVIINRTRSGRFAPDVCGVVKQRGQFGFVRGGEIPAVPQSRAAYRTAIAVAKVAMAEAWQAPAADALYFNGARERHAGVRRIALIGHHAFYR